MVKRSIESKIFGIRILRPEMEIMRQTRGQESGDKQREQRTQGDCWQWKANGQCSRRDTLAVSDTIRISVQKQHSRIRLRILSCSRMSENHREPEVPEEEVPVAECLDDLTRIFQRNLHQFIL